MIVKRIGFGLLALLAIGIGLYPLIYLFVDQQFGLLSTKPAELLGSHWWSVSFYFHITFGGLALLIGWTQFVSRLRQRYLNVHRFAGKVYLLSVGISGFLALYLARYATGGWGPSLGFSLLGMLWLGTSAKAFVAIRKGAIRAHERWMIRSYALTLAAVTLRIWLPLLVSWYQGDFVPAYQIVAWLAWIPNLLLAEWLIYRIKGS